MMRKATILIALLLLPLSLFSISVNGNEIENPFPSRENLEAFGFERQSDIFRGIEVNLITTETGKEIYSYFGHTSLEVLIPGYRPVFYDYGYFSFSEGFYRNFLFGRLFYNVYASDGEMRLRGFEAEDRSDAPFGVILHLGKDRLFDMLKVKNLGIKSIDEVIQKLESYGLSLRKDEE